MDLGQGTSWLWLGGLAQIQTNKKQEKKEKMKKAVKYNTKTGKKLRGGRKKLSKRGKKLMLPLVVWPAG